MNNAIIPTSNAVVNSEPTRYVSIFEDPDAYAAKFKMAEALSHTQFVPEAFRGKAEDCLVALDMAARLDLNPLAVFPDIYVIDNRASFSSKFLIALVNRSGRFSRIKFEEGVDGEVEVTFSGWGEQRGQRKTWKEKVPNYWAKASFTELASGEVFTSPKVDMVFADKNGWVQKSGSKWQTMPEIMCRYRSASILIKSVCPEIVMGMEWADDLQDAREEGRAFEMAPRRIYDAAPRPSSLCIEQESETETSDKAIETLQKCIENAKSLDDLASVGKMIADSGLSENARTELRTLFKTKQDSLTKKPGKRAKKEKEEVAPQPAPPEPETEKKLLEILHNAADLDALGSVRDEIEIATTRGLISGKTYGSLMDVYQTRLDEIRNAEPEVEKAPTSEVDGTEEQIRWARNLCAAMKSATSEDVIESNLETARSWLESGYTTESLLAKIEEYGAKLKAEIQEK